MLHFLDSKSHFLFVIDKVVGQKSKDDDEEEEDVHVNLTEPLETWLRVKNYHRNKFKKLGENAAATIKEKQKAKREAKERVNKARMEKKEKETKRRRRKNKRARRRVKERRNGCTKVDCRVSIMGMTLITPQRGEHLRKSCRHDLGVGSTISKAPCK